MNLLLSHGASTDVLWMGESYEETYLKYNDSSPARPADQQAVLERIKTCRLFLKEDETIAVFKSVCAVLDELCMRLSIKLKTPMYCSLSGSFMENTKCFAPDEFDFIFSIMQPTFKRNDLNYFASKCYLVIDSIIRHDPLSWPFTSRHYA